MRLEHQVYPLLRKGETLRLFSSYEMRVLPLTRTVVRRLLQEMAQHKDRLSKADRRLLQQMLGEFIDPGIGEKAPRGSEIHLIRFEEGQTQLFFDLRGIQNFRFSRNRLGVEDEDVSETTLGGAVRVRFSEHLFLGMSAQNTMILGPDSLGENFNPITGIIISTTGKVGFTDQATGYLAGRWGRFGPLAGRNVIAWGSGLATQTALSRSNLPMDLLQFKLDFRTWRFSYFHGSLQGIAPQRYLAGHRLDFMFWPSFQFGLYETVVYGGRGWEMGYLNPFLPYHVMEHQLGDRDNNMLGVDFTWLPGAGWRIYGEVFFDDLSFEKPLGTYWGNKLAYLLGVHWAQPLNLRTLELFASYTRVDPWVYTHADSINIYAHYGVSIGAKLGPNADRLQLGLAWQPLRDTRWNFTYRFIRKGKGDIFTPHKPEDGLSKGFLKGVIERRQEFNLRLRQQVRRDIFLGFDLTLRHRRDADQVAGQNRWERFAAFFLDMDW